MIKLGDQSDPVAYAKHCIASAQAVFRSFNMGIHVVSSEEHRRLHAEWADNPNRLPHRAALEVLVTGQRCLEQMTHAHTRATLLTDVARDFAVLGRLEMGLFDLALGLPELARAGASKREQLAEATEKAAVARRRSDRREGIVALLIEHPEWTNNKLATERAKVEIAAGARDKDPKTAIMTLLRKEGDKLRAEAAARR